MYNTWVLVANASGARLFGTEKIGTALQCMQEFIHPQSRHKGADLVSDRPGRNQSKGTGHGSMGDPANPKDQEADRFASELASALEKGRTENAYKRLVLIAEPRFHGLLNAHINKHTRSLVTNTIHKDFTMYKEDELPERIKHQINSFK